MELPFPPKELNPNKRHDRRAISGIRKKYKEDCWALTKAQRPEQVTDHLEIVFHPPDGRKRDLDNMLSSFKSGADGISLAIGRDDSHWALTIRKGEPMRPLGCVVVNFI